MRSFEGKVGGEWRKFKMLKTFWLVSLKGSDSSEDLGRDERI